MFINGIEWQLSSLVTFDSCYSNSIDTAPYSIDHIFKRQFKFILNTLDWIDSNIHSDTLRMVLVLKTVNMNMNMEHHHLTENLGLNFILYDWEFYCRSQFRFDSFRFHTTRYGFRLIWMGYSLLTCLDFAAFPRHSNKMDGFRWDKAFFSSLFYLNEIQFVGLFVRVFHQRIQIELLKNNVLTK